MVCRTKWLLRDSFHSYWARSKENAVPAFPPCYRSCFMVATKPSLFQEPGYSKDEMLWNASTWCLLEAHLLSSENLGTKPRLIRAAFLLTKAWKERVPAAAALRSSSLPIGILPCDSKSGGCTEIIEESGCTAPDLLKRSLRDDLPRDLKVMAFHFHYNKVPHPQMYASNVKQTLAWHSFLFWDTNYALSYIIDSNVFVT